MTIYTDYLNALLEGKAELPLMVRKMELGGIKRWEKGYAEKEIAVNREWFSGVGLFGGYIASLADQTMFFASASTMASDEVLSTSELNVKYYQAIKEGPLTIKATVISTHEQQQDVAAEIYCGATLMAKAFATQIIKKITS